MPALARQEPAAGADRSTSSRPPPRPSTPRREEFAAAVASRAAADAYGLNVLAENIEDQPHNVTRFAVIAERAEQRTGRDKTTLMLRLPNQAGALAKAIAPFEKNGVNMTWIESFPTTEGKTDRDPTYLFFLDIEGHADDEPVQRALEAVRKRCERLEVLGSYPRGSASRVKSPKMSISAGGTGGLSTSAFIRCRALVDKPSVPADQEVALPVVASFSGKPEKLRP